MFKYIKEAKYYMHGSASKEVKDLLNRMLQPNPFKRITIPEIIQHPWFQAQHWQIKYYDRFLLQVIHGEEAIDQEIIDELFNLKLKLNPKDREKIEKAISNGEKYDFCIAYEYLKHSKMLQKFESLKTKPKEDLKFDKSLLLKNSKNTVKHINDVHQKLESFDRN